MKRNIACLPLLLNLSFVIGAAMAAGGGWKPWMVAFTGAVLLCFMARYQVPPRRCGAVADAGAEPVAPLKAPFWF